MDAVIEQANEATRHHVVRKRASQRRRAPDAGARGGRGTCWPEPWPYGNGIVARPWLLRTLLFQDATYPKQTALTVEGGNPLRVVRGGTLTVTVHADPDRVVPGTVTYHMRFPSLGDLVETVKPTASDAASFVKVFPSVTEPFTFFVTGNDDRTAKIKCGAR